MEKEDVVTDIKDKGIIRSFDLLDAKILPRKTIVKYACMLTGESSKNIETRIDNRQNKPKNYLIKVCRGEYKLNPEFNFIFEGEPLLIDIDSKELPSHVIPENRASEINPERKEHTSDLKKAIEIWRENFPKPPGLLENLDFYYLVEQCEQYPLYHDLSNHLPQSGFDVHSRWEQFKNNVNKLEEFKKYFLNDLENTVSDMFKGVTLNFVEYNDIMQYEDLKEYYELKGYDELAPPTPLNDFECSLPRLMYDRLLYRLDIDYQKLKYYKRESAKKRSMEAKKRMEEESKYLLEYEYVNPDTSAHWTTPWSTHFSDTSEGFEICHTGSSRNCLGNIDNRLESSEREVKPRIWLETLYKYDIRAWRVERMMRLPIVEKDNSIIWGEDEDMELIRLPKSYERVLIQGKDKVLTFFSDGPDPTIENKVMQIHRKFRLLEQERDYMIKELERSLYCMSFSGDCRYLGI